MKNTLNILLLLLFTYSLSQKSDIYEVEFIKYFIIDEKKFYESSSNNPDREVVERNKRTFTEEQIFSLICDKNESLFNNVAKLDNSQTENEIFENNGNRIVYNNNSGLVLYRNLTKNIYLIPNDKKTMIQDSLYNFDWNINFIDEREILGYKVKKATAKGLEEGTNITAWYTPEIKISQGPYLYWGLPGLILEIDIDVYSDTGLAYFIDSYHFKAKKITKLDSNQSLTPNTKKKNILSPEELKQKDEAHAEKVKEYLGGEVDKD